MDVDGHVHEDARRKGVGRALYASLFAPLHFQGFYNSYAGATLPNPVSVGLHESVGFRPLGIYRGVGYKLGAWHDVVWWYLPIHERIAGPDLPAYLPSVLESEEWGAAVHSPSSVRPGAISD